MPTPKVFQDGTTWTALTFRPFEVHDGFATWAEAYHLAFTAASVAGAQRLRQAMADVVDDAVVVS